MLSLMVMLQDLLIMYQRHRSNPCHVVGCVRCPQTVKVSHWDAGLCACNNMNKRLHKTPATCSLALNLAWNTTEVSHGEGYDKNGTL